MYIMTHRLIKQASAKLTMITSRLVQNDDLIYDSQPNSPRFRDSNLIDSPFIEDKWQLGPSYRYTVEGMANTGGHRARDMNGKIFPYRNATPFKTGMHVETSLRQHSIRPQKSSSKNRTRIDHSSRSRIMSSKQSRPNSFREEDCEIEEEREKHSNQGNLSIDEAPMALEALESPVLRKRVDSETINLKNREFSIRKFRKSQQFQAANLLSSRASPINMGDKQNFKSYERNNTTEQTYRHASTSLHPNQKNRFDICITNSCLNNKKASTIRGMKDQPPGRNFSVRTFVKDKFKARRSKFLPAYRKATIASQDQSQGKDGKSMNMEVVVPVHAELASMDSLEEGKDRKNQEKETDRLGTLELKRYGRRAIKTRRIIQVNENSNMPYSCAEIVSTTPDLTLRMARKYKPKVMADPSILHFSQDMSNYLEDLKTKTLTRILLARKNWNPPNTDR